MKLKNLRTNKWFRLAFTIALLGGLIQCTGAKKDNKEKINSIIAQMTLKQKAELLIGTGMYFELPDSIAKKFNRPEPEIKDTVYHDMVEKIRKELPGAAGFTAEYPDLGVTTQVLADGPAGLRISPKRKGEDKTYYCTAFPIATLLASTWDTDLVNEVGKAMGNEVLEYNADVLLGPAMNLQRDPLCGRNFEYYSEDPLVTGKMAAAMVKGIQSNGIGTSIKHFAANNQETNRLSVNTIVSQRALRELYLKSFEIAVKEAQPRTVMSSYNKINGVYASESNDLLTKILRNDWGFKGYVMTDWGGGSDVVAQMKAGNDLIMPGQPKQVEDLIAAVNDGRLEESVLDQNLARILNIMMESPKQKGIQVTNNPDLKAHAEVTRQAASEGMVLLENKNNALPLSSDIKNIAVFGTTSYDFISGGTGSGDVNEAYTVSLIQGIENANLAVDEELSTIYNAYIKSERAKKQQTNNWLAALLGGKIPVAEMDLKPELAKKAANNCDVALITIGRNSGEGQDRQPTPGDFYLTDTEKALIKNVSEAFQAVGKKAIVILNVGGVVETATWNKLPDAVLCAWQPGQEAGNSVMDVLTGKVNPSGKLAVTWPVLYEDSPTAKNFPGEAIEIDKKDDAKDLSGFSFMRRVPWKVVYKEDIYVGYRYYSSFEVPVSYEFGYGLSYTNFEYSNIKLSNNSFAGKIKVSVDVKNTGATAGKEVVQVYDAAPKGKLEKPAEVLVAFGKTKELNPGEMQTMNFTVGEMDLASFDESTSSWIIEPGEYTLKVGDSSTKIQQTGTFKVDKEINAGVVSNALAPQENIDRLTRK